MSKLCIVLAKKKYRGVIFHETEGGHKIWRGIDSMSELYKIMSNSNHPLNFLNKDLP